MSKNKNKSRPKHKNNIVIMNKHSRKKITQFYRNRMSRNENMSKNRNGEKVIILQEIDPLVQKESDIKVRKVKKELLKVSIRIKKRLNATINIKTT